jgi:hypothetical protein
MLTEQDIRTKLVGVPEGTELFVSYVPGGRITERAQREATKADHMGVSRRWLQGRLQRAWRTEKGDLAVCIFTYTRYNEDDPSAEGHYRTINPSLGTVLAFEVLHEHC